jgi:large subunit ribosomal protein L19
MQKVHTSVNVASRAGLGIRPGDTVRVEQKIIEFKRGKGTDKKEKITKTARTQAFEGLVLAVKHGAEAGASFTVRATLSGVGVEKVFPLYSPAIDSIEIVRRSKVRRAKLYFIREKAAKEVKKQLRNARRVSITEEVEVAPEVAPTIEDVAVAVAEEAIAE